MMDSKEKRNMEKSNTNWQKVFLAFGVVTILSGLYLIFEQDYLIGISGSIVGLGLVLQNIQKIRK